MRRAWKGWVTAAVVGCAPAALASTVVEPRARVSLEGRYDDDFRLNAGGTGGQFMTKLTPRLGLDVKDPTLTLESFYAADLLVRHGSGNLSLDHRGGVSVRKLLSRRLRVDVSGGLYRVTDPTSLPRESVARAAQPVLYGQARVYAAGRVGRRWDVGVGYMMEGVRVLEGNTASGFVHNPYVEGWFRASRRLTLGAEYRYQAFLFGEALDQAHGVGGALRYRFTRQLTATLRAGPVSYLGADGTRGLLPRVKLEVLQEIPGRFDLGFVAGHDLVGASGFSNALWADYAGLVVNHHFNSRLSVYGASSFFRNGRAPNEGAFSWDGGARVAQGYAVGGGVRFKVNEYLSVQGAMDRIAQVGMDEAAVDAVGLTRNVAAVRLHMTAF